MVRADKNTMNAGFLHSLTDDLHLAAGHAATGRQGMPNGQAETTKSPAHFT
jgi:hypothetical protein